MLDEGSLTGRKYAHRSPQQRLGSRAERNGMASIKTMPDGLRGATSVPVAGEPLVIMERCRACLKELGPLNPTQGPYSVRVVVTSNDNLTVCAKARLYQDSAGIYLDLTRRRRAFFL